MENIVEILLDRYRETQEYAKNSVDIFHQTDIQTAQDTFVNPAFEKDFETGNNLDRILTDALTAMEGFGFRQGFKCALKLAAECELL